MNITNDKVSEYIYSLYHPLTENLSRLRDEGEKRHVPIILRDSETLLVTVIRMMQPKRILEIGTAIGYSAAVFSTAAPDAQITTIEIDPLYAEDAKKNLIDYGNVQLIEGDAAQVMHEMAVNGEPEPFDLVFIDAAKSHYREFFDGALRLTGKGSVIICDNILMQARTVSEDYDERGRFRTNVKYMRSFLEYISGFEGAGTSILPAGDGMSISVIL